MQAWLNFLNHQEQSLGKETVDQWLRPLSIVHFDSGNLYLEAQNAFQIAWFEEHIRPHLKKHLVNNNYRQIKVHITSAENCSPTPSRPAKGQHAVASAPTLVMTPDAVESSATLSKFVCGKNNQLLLQFFNELIEGKTPLGSFNPIYLYGSPGTGKTHLLMALTQAFQANGLNARYVRAETFTEHVVSAIKNSEMQLFRKSYRSVDLLLIDDFHIFARRSATQEEFFHTFNALHTSSRQIIISSHCLPSGLEEIEPRLVSRCEWGIPLHLEPLAFDELAQVLLNRCQALEFPLSQEVITFLLTTFPSHLPTLTRALEALVLRSHMQSYPPTSITPQIAAEFLSTLISEENNCALTPQKIVATVAGYYGLKSEDVLGKSQTQECVIPRQIAMYLCRTTLHLAFMKIGRIFDRDHSTVMTSVKQIAGKLSAKDPDLYPALTEIKKRMEIRNHIEKRPVELIN